VWRATFKGLLAHKFRLALTALAVVLGVAFVTGTYVLTDTISRSFEELFETARTGVDVEVRAEASFVGTFGDDRERIRETLLDRILEVEGVAHAEGEVTGYAQLVDKQGEAIAPQGPPTFGLSWPDAQGLSALAMREGRPPAEDGEVAIDAATANAHGFEVGDAVTILFQGPAEEFEVVGIVGFGEADNLLGATMAAFELRTAQRVLGAEGRFDSIAVTGEGDVSPAELRNRIREVLPPGVEAQTGAAVTAEQTDALRQGLGFFSTALLVFAGVALFVGAFIIFNTFNILVTQRTRELALLRAIGATPGQVTRSVVAEALVVGLVASILGLAGGILVAVGLQAVLSAFGAELPTTTLQILPRTVVVAFVIGMGVTLVASIFPARRAARIPPVAAMKEIDAVRPLRVRRRLLAGGAVLGGGVAVLLVGLFADVGNALAIVGVGVATTFLGVAVLSPLLSRSLARLVGAPAARLAGLSGRLGRQNAMRNPRRTAATSSALMIGLGLVATFLIMGSSIRASVGRAIEETFRADYLVAPTTGMGGGFSPMVAAHLREQPELDAVSQVRMGEWRDGTSSRFLSAVDPDTVEEVFSLGEVGGDLSSMRPTEVFLLSTVAEQRGLGIGDTLEMEFAASGMQRMEVAGTYTESGILGDYLISLGAHELNFSESLDQWVLVRAAPGTGTGQARAALDRVLEAAPNLQVQDQAELRRVQEQQVDQLLGLVTALLGLAVLIALLGIINTLVLSVYERTREIGLLRAVGMSRSQVRRMIRWESVIIALLGGIIGLAVGIFFGWALVAALADQGVTEFGFPLVQLLAFLGLAGVLGVVAALGPARRAARLDVLQAIAYE
jgi:putative ABC transport system permease protein